MKKDFRISNNELKIFYELSFKRLTKYNIKVIEYTQNNSR